jgi:hypothetical protein
MGGNSNGVLFWALLFFLILREGDQRFYKDPSPRGRPLPGRTACPLGVVPALLAAVGRPAGHYPGLAWSGTETVFSGLEKVLQIPRQCWDSSFTLRGLLSAALILFSPIC